MTMKRSKLILSAVMVVASGLPSCTRWSAECEDLFLNTPHEQLATKFRAYPIERQLDLYLCGMTVHPPVIESAYIIAERGEEAIPFVLSKLKSVNNEQEQEDLIYILEVMSNRGHLRGKRDVVDEIRQVIMRMQIGIVRSESLQRLRRIEANT